MAKTSVAGAVQAAKREDARARKALAPPPPAQRKRGDLHTGTSLGGVATADSFVNFAHKLGVGADNALTSGTYGYNPVSRNRMLMEWIHRGSWLGGQAVDVVADDMTRAGVTLRNEMDPADQEILTGALQECGFWDQLNASIKWGRLYGGALAVALIDGQDPKTPLRPEAVGADKFKGLLVLDRWMVEPSLNDLVTDYGPDLGLPKFYKVGANAPAMRLQQVHFTRVLGRFVGIELPYQQSLTENMWGISVLERLYDRMIAFDSASTGAAQLVFKSHLRTLSIDGLREIVASGGQAMNGILAYTEMMRRFQGVEGMTLLDAKDKFEVQQSSAFTGVSDVVRLLAEQVSGALQIPLTRLFGQSPGGLSNGDESGERTYYDGIGQKQNRTMRRGVTLGYQLMARSKGIELPENFGLDFASLYDLDDTEKADIAAKVAETVTKAKEAGLVSDRVSLQELRQSSKITGVFTNITQELIDAADDMVQPPLDEQQLDHTMNQAAVGNDMQERQMDQQDQQAEQAAREAAMPAPPGGAKGAPGGATPARRRARPEG